MPLSARDDHGKPVDWWFMYKVSGKSERSDGKAANGAQYTYFDANGVQAKSRLKLSPNVVTRDGALANTLDQLYGKTATSNKKLGYFFYNDENPINKQVVMTRGHTKGVLAFDLASDSAFWLVQSVPLFPSPKSYAYPSTGIMMAQTLLCVTLKDAQTSAQIAKQMCWAQQPNVYYASPMPAGLAASDDRALLMKDTVANGEKPLTATVPFKSKAGHKFISIAKNGVWGKDFYNDLVGPRLAENLDVETWEHGATPGPKDSDKIHKVEGMKSVNLAPLGVPYSWSESFDHAKLAISCKGQKTQWVCVGDINFTLSQEQRGGGTVAFMCDPLWKCLSEVLSASAEPPPPKPKGASRPASGAKPPRR